MAFAGYLEQAQPWDSQPQDLRGPADAWLDRGLVALFDTRHAVEVVSGARATNVTSKLAPSNGGVAADFSSTANQQYAHRAAYAQTGDITILAYLDVDALASYGALIAKQATTSTYTPYELRLGASATDSQINLVRCDATTLSSRNVSLTNLVTAPAKTLRLAVTATGSLAFTSNAYVNGAKATNATGASGIVQDNGSSAVWIGRRFDGATQLDGRIYYVALFNRILSDAEIAEWDANPWSLYEPEVIQTSISSATVAPSNFLTFSLSLAIQQAQALTASLSAAVQAPVTASAVANAAVQAARSAQASLETAVQTAASAVASLSTAVQASGQQAASIDGALQLARSATVALDLAVQAHLSATTSVNLQVQAAASATASLNLQIQAGSSASVSLSMAVLQSALSAVGLDLAVLRVGSQTAGISAALQAARSAAAAIDIALQIVRSTTAAIDVVLQAARSSSSSVNLQIQDGVSALVGIDLAVQQARTAVVGVQLAIGQSATTSASVDAVAMLQRLVSAALGGAVSAARIASAGLSFYIDDGGAIVITGPIRLLAIISQEIAFEATIEQV